MLENKRQCINIKIALSLSMDITQADFENYVSVQKSGVTNMFDIRAVQNYTDLSREKIYYIMEHYAELMEKNTKDFELEPTFPIYDEDEQ